MSPAEPRPVVVDAHPAVPLLSLELEWVDLLNVGRKAQRQGAISLDPFLAIGGLAPGLSSEWVPAAPLRTAAQNWCRALDHPVYDCLSLALAEMRSAVLLTQDQRQLKKSWKPC